MNRDDIIRMAREVGCIPRRHPEYDNDVQVFATPDVLERFAALVAAHERERIIDLNAPEIEKINAHFKRLEDAIAAERERCAQICDSVAANAVLGTANECARAIRGQ